MAIERVAAFGSRVAVARLDATSRSLTMNLSEADGHVLVVVTCLAGSDEPSEDDGWQLLQRNGQLAQFWKRV